MDLKSNFSGEEKYDFSNEVLEPAQSQEPAQNIKSLNKHDLLDKIRQAAKTEQNLTLQVIELIAEILRRKAFLDFGYGSIFDFVTQDLGYEPSSAMRRIQAARAILEMPELKAKIADHSLSLTVVSQAQSYLRKKANDQRQKISLEEKTELYKSLENKSAKEAEKELFKLSPELCLKSREQEKVLSENLTELRFVIDSETKAKADELKLWLSHQNPDMTQAQFYKVMVEKLHRQLDPNKPKKLRKKSARTENNSKRPEQDKSKSAENKSESSLQKNSGKTLQKKFETNLNEKSQTTVKNKPESVSPVKPTNPQIDFNQSITAADNAGAKNSDPDNSITDRGGGNISQNNSQNAFENKSEVLIESKTASDKPKSLKRSRYISQTIKNKVWLRDQACCQFVDPKTNRKCESRYQIQLDHIYPFRHLGEHSEENLRLYCGQHNRMRG